MLEFIAGAGFKLCLHFSSPSAWLSGCVPFFDQPWPPCFHPNSSLAFETKRNCANQRLSETGYEYVVERVRAEQPLEEHPGGTNSLHMGHVRYKQSKHPAAQSCGEKMACIVRPTARIHRLHLRVRTAFEGKD